MKIKLLSTFLMFILVFIVFQSNSLAENYTKMNLPEGPIARFGKGGIKQIKYSPDGSLLGVASGIGVWIYNTSPTKRLTYSPDIQRLSEP